MGKRQVLHKTLKVEKNKATLASGWRMAHVGTPGRKVSWANRDAVRWSWLWRSPDTTEDRKMGKLWMGWGLQNRVTKALRLGDFISRRAWASVFPFCLFLPLYSRCAGVDQ